MRRNILRRTRTAMNGGGGQGTDAEVLATLISWCMDVAPLFIILGLTAMVGGVTWCVIRLAQALF